MTNRASPLKATELLTQFLKASLMRRTSYNQTTYSFACYAGVNGLFTDWFHPYYRSAYGKAHVQYRLQTQEAYYAAHHASDDAKVDNLDRLVNLSSRWTKRFKAEYRLVQKSLHESIQQGRVLNSQQDVQRHLEQGQERLSPERAWYEVHVCLFNCLKDQARLDAWLTELASTQ